jgi:1,4-alpha-glucan branching enzyme
MLNSDSHFYGGSNTGPTNIKGQEGAWHSQPCNITVLLPPLAGMVLKPVRDPNRITRITK